MRDIMREPTVPLAALGRRLGMSHTAVRARLDRLRAIGVLHGFIALPHPAYLRSQARLHTWQRSDFDPTRIAEVVAVPGVAFAIAGHSGDVAAMVYGPDSSLPEGIRSILGEPVKVNEPRFAVAAPPALSPLGARVLAVLVDDPRSSVERIASAAKVSRKTARKQRDLLLGSGALEIVPILVAVAESGVILFHVHADFDDPQQLRRLQEAAGPHAALLSVMHDPPSAYLFGRADSLLEVVQLETRVREAAGASLLVPMTAAVARHRLHDWAALIARPSRV